MMAATPLKLAILISGRGSNMEALARACQAGTLAARVAVVIADREAAAGLAAARELGLATATVLPSGGTAGFERALEAEIARYRAGALALAGFMRVLSQGFVGRYLGRMFNIHPSLLPKYRGLHTHRRVLEAGDALHGASVHFVTAELDAGPVVLQSCLEVRAGDTEASRPSERCGVEWLLAHARKQQRRQRGPTRQASDMGGEDASFACCQSSHCGFRRASAT